MKRLYSITVRGNHHTWDYLVWGLPEHATEWTADGIDVAEVLYTIPEIIQRMGLVRPWCWLQKIGLLPKD